MSKNINRITTSSRNSNSCRLKQGSLFSFFTKKPKDASNTVARTSASSNMAEKNGPEVAGKVASEDIKHCPPRDNNHHDTVMLLAVGAKIDVFWPDDDEYYTATVKEVMPSRAPPKHVVQYDDDGIIETLDLSKEIWRHAQSNQTFKQRNNVVESQGEDTDEYELVEAKDDDYEEEEEEEEDEYDDFLVDSSEEEEEQRSRKKACSGKRRRLIKVIPCNAANSIVSENNNRNKKHKKLKHSATTVSQDEDKDSSSAKNFLSPVFQRFSANIGTTKEPAVPTKESKALVTPPPPSAVLSSNTNKHTATKNNSSLPATGMFQEGEVNPVGTHVHNHLSFLYPPKLRDAKGNPYNSSDYDPRTLKFGPTEEAEICKLLQLKGGLTPASKQWWEIKSKYFDTILFFKTGKFYEIYNMDADVACRELGFVYMKGAIAHSGFPESAYGVMSGRLIDKGYKVARVEQTETPEQLAERKKKTSTGKKPQVVNREVCSIVSSGTRTYCFLDDTRCFNGSDELRCSNGPLLSIKEVLLPLEEEGKAVCEYGITIVDAVRSVITVGQFADDVLRSRMLTLLTTFTPSEILLEEGNSSKELIQLIQMTQTARIEKVRAEEEFPQSNAILEKHRNALSRSSPCHPWDERETVEELSRKRYFSRRKSKKNTVAENDSWPEVLFACIQGEAKLALSSLGAALFYLQRALIDEEIFTFGCVKAYIPPGSPNVPDEQSSESRREANSGSIVGSQSVAGTPTLCELSAAYAAEADGLLNIGTNDKSVSSAGSNSFMDNYPHAVTPEENSSEHHPPCPASTDHMQVDGTTIENLELLFNQSDKTSQNSLWAKLNHTKTPHGFRLLRAWLLRPLFRRVDIQRRQDAVAELCVGSAALAMTEARPMLQKVGDLERLLSRVHAMGGSGSSSANPNERAMLYEGAIYTQRKMNDFQKLIQGLYCAGKVIDLFSPENCTGIENCLLRKIVRRQRDGGCFPDNLEEELRWFSSNSECFDENYDAACADIERIEQELQRYKSEMCRQLGRNANAQWTYINTKPDSRDKYLIELPVSIPVPQDFYIKAKRGSGAKQVNKYRTSFVEGLVNDLEAALEEKKAGEERSTQLLFQKFDSLRTIWSAVAHATAMLDALGSLAYVSSMPDMVRPTVLDENSLPTLYYRQGRHFCVDVTHDGVGFIPNDLTLGGCPSVDGKSSPRVLLLSGPNMGGKSTILRQTCLIAIMAQIGCFVPAQECSLTPVDRIFTRLGASDRILSGQSTFFVELAETAAALRGATRRSLVIMDELGRGTSTFDGTAIASATVKHLVEASGCLVMFATHYHSLLEDFRETPSVRLGHMECLVEEEKNNNITFLYTLGEGVCPKSFGINVARLAGLPEEVLKIAEKKSSAFEEELCGTVEEDKLINEVTAAVEAGDLLTAERIWEKLQQ